MNVGFRLLVLSGALALTGCFGGSSSTVRNGGALINDEVKFTAHAYGVAASPRVSRSRKVRKGGGRRQIGKPYKIRGKWYRPREQPGYDKSGSASWYGPNFHGRLTANGEIYDQYALSAAHPTFPLPSYARVINKANGHSVIVRVNDRGPYHAGRIIDLSARAAKLLDYQHAGVAQVRVQYIGPAPLDGLDETYLAASFKPAGSATSLAFAQEAARPEPASASTQAAEQAVGDPFLLELEALRKRQDTGTTLALREPFTTQSN